MSVWCAELHAQLADLAEERNIPLLLMGGNAAALRLEAAKQRGSRDNDYLTTATELDIRGLMDALVARFAPHFEEPLFRYRELHGGSGAEPLPLVAFAFDVPSLLDTNAREGRLSIKLEFHSVRLSSGAAVPGACSSPRAVWRWTPQPGPEEATVMVSLGGSGRWLSSAASRSPLAST